MFIPDGILCRSSVLSGIPGVCHGFSGRAGGVSVLEHTRSLNLTVDLGDPDETVRRNTEIFCRAVSGGVFGADSGVKARQIHSTRIRILDRSHAGEGAAREAGEDCDGFLTDAPGVLPMIRVADRLKREGLEGKLILQVHDELIVECPEAEADRVKALLKEEMEGAGTFAVPLLTDAGAGRTWAEAKG